MQSFNQQGYIAVSSVLVIMVVVITLGISTSLLSINDIQTSLTYKLSEESLDIVEGCVELALLELSRQNSLPSSITLPEGDCAVNLISQNGTDWTFTVSGIFGNFSKEVLIVAQKETKVEVLSWTEN